MDMNNTKTSRLLSHKFSKSLLSNLEFAYERDQESFRGWISDIFVWDYSLSSSEMKSYTTCDINQIWKKAKIQWKNLEKYWTVKGDRTSHPRDHMCRNDDFWYYVGFVKTTTFKDAMKFCSSLGGQLPFPFR